MPGEFKPLDNALGFGEVLEATGKAHQCVANKSHTPRPLRFVWHHVLPQVCGGATESANLASLCDNCHYGVHVLLFNLASNNGVLSTAYARFAASGRYSIALRGYNAAVAAGTAHLIPNEGGSTD